MTDTERYNALKQIHGILDQTRASLDKININHLLFDEAPILEHIEEEIHKTSRQLTKLLKQFK